jgi:hypothetical protein
VYRGDEIAWDEAKRQCRNTLYGWAAAGEYHHTYTELVDRVTAIEWPQGPHTDEGSQVGFLLGQVSLEELDRVEDRPLISALVIGKDENMPSSGFWGFCAEVSIAVADRQLFWLKEAKACCEFYGRKAAT